MLQSVLKAEMTTVSYKGTAPEMTDLMGGTVDLMCEQATNAVLAKLNDALRGALKDPDLIKRQEALGISVVSDARVELAAHKKFVEGEVARWAEVIQAAGAYAD
jgi:tripartite-type tricarboxylate transporter receptor subunit TctC